MSHKRDTRLIWAISRDPNETVHSVHADQEYAHQHDYMNT